MLHDAWLLSDLDGTLISTPHKACGQYLSLDQSPCIHALRRWLLNGGNICIITTADMRVLEQVYLPLRPILRDAAGNNSSCGELLLSLYTGAVLYRCIASGVELVREYAEATHYATTESVELATRYGVQLKESSTTRVYPNGVRTILPVTCIEGTCFSMNTCRELLQRVEGIFLDVVKGILKKDNEILEALSHMSARYKEMWRILLHYLDVRYEEHNHSVDALSGKATSTGRVARTDPVVWKCEFLHRRRRFLRSVGILRVEVVDTRRIRANIDEGHTANETVERAKLSLLRVLGDESKDASLFAEQMIRLLGNGPCSTDDNSNNNNHMGNSDNDKSSESNEAVAQVMVVGIPIKLFSRFFTPQLGFFTSICVSAIPQPNSVVFSKMGVCKSTIVRYLIKGQPHDSHDPNQYNDHHHQQQQQQQRMQHEESIKKKEHDAKGNGYTPHAAPTPRFYGVVDITRAVALGDNPHTTDFELTIFPQLPFISVEVEEQRRRRHAHIDVTPTMGQTRQRRGFTMDDRRLVNSHYVGGEENGTAVFLNLLMDVLRVPPTPSAGDIAQANCKRQGTFGAALVEASEMSRAVLSNIPSRL